MKRRWKVALVTVSYVTVAVLSFLYVFGFPPFHCTLHLTAEQLRIWSCFWVGKRVSIEGEIIMSFCYEPEHVPPCNCLIDSNHGSFGILWNKTNHKLACTAHTETTEPIAPESRQKS
jgi:hypothetical protein